MSEVKVATITKSSEFDKVFSSENDRGAGTAKDNCCGGSELN